jgi:hypothetical protein
MLLFESWERIDEVTRNIMRCLVLMRCTEQAWIFIFKICCSKYYFSKFYFIFELADINNIKGFYF